MTAYAMSALATEVLAKVARRVQLEWAFATVRQRDAPFFAAAARAFALLRRRTAPLFVAAAWAFALEWEALLPRRLVEARIAGLG